MGARNVQMAYQLVMDWDCSGCGKELDPNELKLNSSESSDVIYESVYDCPECGTIFDIVIEDENRSLKAEFHNRDYEDNPDRLPGTKSTIKDSLYAKNHPGGNRVKAIRELVEAWEKMKTNQENVAEKCDILREPTGFDTPPGFETESRTTIDGFLASAYTFSEILENARGDLCMDGPVEPYENRYESQKRPVIGLRIYSQHEGNLPTMMSSFTDPKTGDYIRSLTVELEDVNVIESDKDRYPPDGYKKDASHHYGDINGEKINIDKLSKNHCDVSGELVNEIAGHTYNTHENEIDEYLELEDPTTNIVEN